MVTGNPATASETTVATSKQEQASTYEQPQPSPCGAELEQRRKARTDFLALDLFKDSTEHEEYRLS